LSGPAAFSQMTAVRADLRVVFSTGYTAEAASLNPLMEQGASILQKPYSLKNLGQMVRSILDRPRTSFVPNEVSEIHR
jgi:DNA-binding NtrC family response regulator